MPWLRSLLRAFRRPFRHLRRHRAAVTVGLLFVPVHAAISLWMPRLLGDTLDQLTVGGSAAGLATTCWLLLGLAAAEALARFVSRKIGRGETTKRA